MPLLRCSIFLCCLLVSGLVLGASHPVMDAVQKRLKAFHTGEKSNKAIVRVVYFHAADREPLQDYAARLDRAMTDISHFFEEGMERRFSIKSAGIPLERLDGKLVIHRVKGLHPASHYKHESGDETWGEVQKALAGTLDPEREHVLILYGLCEQEESGMYVFNAPYYGAGWSDHRRGLCHAADCEKLDPELLKAKNKPFVFREHYYDKAETTVTKFNSMYLGGIAHELGHGLGFPHDNGGPNEERGVSLMGGGNLHYRENLWGGKNPSYLSLATAIRFAAHPLVTKSDKERWKEPDAAIENLTTTSTRGALRISGRVTASVPPCAVIASVWPTTAKTDHGAMTFCSAVDDAGNFQLQITHLNASEWNLTLGTLLVNGSESVERLTFQCAPNGTPDAGNLAANWTLQKAEQAFMKDPELAKRLLGDGTTIAAAPEGEVRRRLEILRSLVTPQSELVNLALTRESKVFLSDAGWENVEVGWGRVVRNHFSFADNRNQGVFLQIGGEVFGKGLYAHSPSNFSFELGGKWKTFSGIVGLRDGAASQGSAVFTIIGDGKELYQSKILRGGEKDKFCVRIQGVKELQLKARGGEGHPHNSWAIWCDPLLEK